jgi:hypothetical protein
MCSSIRALFALTGLILLSGCASSGNSLLKVSTRLETADRVSLTGANPLFDSENFEEIDLENTLDPMDLRKKKYRPKLICGKDNPETRDVDERTACANRAFLAAAMSAFYHPDNNKNTTTKDRRNQILDRLLASSEQRCGAYKQYLKAYDIHWETGLGIGTTIMGAAGAIATGTLNSRAFSGLAAMLSGTRSEIRQGVFSNLASFVIIPGIDTKRSKILDAIKENRKLDISDYSVQAALHDAALYHGACTLESGLEVAQDSIRRVDDPGLLQINKTLATLVETKQLARMTDLANVGSLNATNIKIFKPEYSPLEVVLAGGSAKSKSSVEDRALANSKDLLASFDSITKSAGELKIALEAKARDDNTSATDKPLLIEAASKLAKYLEPVSADGAPPKNTLVSARIHLASQTSAIIKVVADDDSLIRVEEARLGGEANATKRVNGLATIATKKAARDAFSLFGFAHLEQATTAAFKSLAELVKPTPATVPNFKKIDDELLKIAAVVAPTRP